MFIKSSLPAIRNCFCPSPPKTGRPRPQVWTGGLLPLHLHGHHRYTLRKNLNLRIRFASPTRQKRMRAWRAPHPDHAGQPVLFHIPFLAFRDSFSAIEAMLAKGNCLCQDFLSFLQLFMLLHATGKPASKAVLPRSSRRSFVKAPMHVQQSIPFP